MADSSPIEITVTGEPPPPEYFQLSIASSPITGFDFTLDEVTHASPYTVNLLKDTSHAVAMPKTLVVGSDIYYFNKWIETGSVNSSIIILLTQNTILTASYTLLEPELTPPDLDLRVIAVTLIVGIATIGIAGYLFRKR